MSEPWYAAGLRFECQPDCGACCTNHDDYAYVYLVGDDLSRLAALLEMTEEECAERYTEVEDGDRYLRMDAPDCPFLDGSRCGVYDARPRQCRTFPFWGESLKTRGRWRGLRKFCPGIGEGETHSLRVIQSHLDDRESGG